VKFFSMMERPGGRASTLSGGNKNENEYGYSHPVTHAHCDDHRTGNQIGRTFIPQESGEPPCVDPRFHYFRDVIVEFMEQEKCKKGMWLGDIDKRLSMPNHDVTTDIIRKKLKKVIVRKSAVSVNCGDS